MVFVIPVLEELLFRGILFTPVARRIGMWKAIGLLTVLGALWHLHFNVVETIRGSCTVVFVLSDLYEECIPLWLNHMAYGRQFHWFRATRICRNLGK